MFTALNVSNMITAGLNLEFGNIRKLLSFRKRSKENSSDLCPQI